jgi:hypothetical protein
MGRGKTWIAVMIAALVVLWPAGNAAAGFASALESRTVDGSNNNPVPVCGKATASGIRTILFSGLIPT